MNCARARFLIYAYLDREISPTEGEALQRHLGGCDACATRAASARGLARLLHSRLDRTPAPQRLRARLHAAPAEPAAERPRYPVFATAAALVVLLLPLASDARRATSAASAASMVSGAAAVSVSAPRLLNRRLTGTFVCLECEARSEAGFCPIAHAEHETGFCAENGELWRLMQPNRSFDTLQASVGRTATVEGVAFPQSGFMRVSRVGY
jgi:hypothetical protein